MKKLRLSLDDLHVDSFDTRINAAPLRGTVPAHENTRPDVCWTAPEYCLSNNHTECNNSCRGTCDNSCYQTCGLNFTCDASCVYGTCPPECYD